MNNYNTQADIARAVKSIIQSIEHLKGSETAKKRISEFVRRVSEFDFREHLKDREDRRWDLFCVAMPYGEYLQTDHWKRKREKVLQLDEYKCRLCSSENQLEVHHRSYLSIGMEKPTDLLTLCGECHDVFHKHRKAEGQKSSDCLEDLSPRSCAAELEKAMRAARKKHEKNGVRYDQPATG